MNSIIELFLLPETYVSLLTLTFMEVVLGIDNIIFLSIITGRLRPHLQGKARQLGLSLAVVFRILLLLALSWLTSLVAPLFNIYGFAPSVRDLILLGGGLFLIAKGTLEIHHKIEGENDQGSATSSNAQNFWSVIVQLVIIDMVFSLDSVITAVGMVEHIPIMVTAILLSLGIMLIVAKQVGDFINEHPTVKVLALSFLVLIGTLLFAEGSGFHVPKGYIYFAMAFSAAVEAINIKIRKRMLV